MNSETCFIVSSELFFRTKPSLWSDSLISFHCLQQNPADSDHFCVSVWRGTRSAIVIQSTETVLSLSCLELSWLHNPDSAAQCRYYFLAWQNATQYTNPHNGMGECNGIEWQMHLCWGDCPKAGGRSLWASAACNTEQADKYMTLQTCSWLWSATVTSVSRAYVVPEFVGEILQ